MTNELVLEGGIWKLQEESSGIIEASSYNALATLSKTSDHGAFMKDTSTNLYYRNWKTGGPGIPVPVEYFKKVTNKGGYASNANGNAFFTLVDDENSNNDLTNRGWTTDHRPNSPTNSNTGTFSKTSGNPAILDLPTGVNGSQSRIDFRTATLNPGYLAILNLHSYAVDLGDGYNGNSIPDVFEFTNHGTDIFCVVHNPTGANRWIIQQSIAYNATTAQKFNLWVRRASGTTHTDGMATTNPLTSLSSGWFMMVVNVSGPSNSNTGDLCLNIDPTNSSQKIKYVATGPFNAGYSASTSDIFAMSVYNYSGLVNLPASLSINEAHYLKI